MTVKDLKDAMLEYVKADPTWNTMTEDARSALIFLCPVTTLGLFGRIALMPDDTEVTLLELIESLMELKVVVNDFNNKKN